jgi:hypothetical protein
MLSVCLWIPVSTFEYSNQSLFMRSPCCAVTNIYLWGHHTVCVSVNPPYQLLITVTNRFYEVTMLCSNQSLFMRSPYCLCACESSVSTFDYSNQSLFMRSPCCLCVCESSVSTLDCSNQSLFMRSPCCLCVCESAVSTFDCSNQSLFMRSPCCLYVYFWCSNQSYEVTMLSVCLWILRINSRLQ